MLSFLSAPHGLRGTKHFSIPAYTHIKMTEKRVERFFEKYRDDEVTRNNNPMVIMIRIIMSLIYVYMIESFLVSIHFHSLLPIEENPLYLHQCLIFSLNGFMENL